MLGTLLSTNTVSVPRLRTIFEGPVIAPNDAGYDEARTVFYGGIDRRPALIIRVQNATDVARAVSLARESGLELAVRSGGHSPAGHGVSDGGIVIDLSDMKSLEVDVGRRTAWAATGLTAGEYTTAAGARGLATGFGDAGSVGVGGITLAGGIGYLVRKYGLAIDNLLAAELVTADGELVRADAAAHPDLFWAIRGGGGNFGVATRFKFRLQEVDTILGGLLMLPATPEIIATFVAQMDAAPEELSTIANIMLAPPMPGLPAEAHGKLVMMVRMVYAGDVETGERAIAPLRSLAEPFVDTVKPMHYPEMYTHDQPRHPIAVTHAMFLDDVDRSAAQAILEHLPMSTAPMAAVEIRVLGGAMARVSAGATAFAHRGSRIMLTVAAMYQRPEHAAIHESWVNDLAAALHQRDSGVYVGFLRNEGEARVREAYPGTTWDRLVAVKNRYDPTNLFHLNQNIPPGGRGTARTLRAMSTIGANVHVMPFAATSVAAMRASDRASAGSKLAPSASGTGKTVRKP
jgi:FAD/FMN-containing dehydrogenase